MRRDELQRICPNASKSLLELNADSNVIEQLGKPSPAKARSMNKTESDFARILEARQRRGEIIAFAYEGLRFKYADGLYYKPDFVVLIEDQPITIIECKGAHVWSRDRVRFRSCAAEWRDWFRFEFWQKKRGQWARVY